MITMKPNESAHIAAAGSPADSALDISVLKKAARRWDCCSTLRMGKSCLTPVRNRGELS